jgi:hypothetical protein
MDNFEAHIIDDILDERRLQDEKWGEQNHPDYVWVTILGEEFGEACKALLEMRSDALYIEIIQMMAVCLAWLECRNRKWVKENGITN